MATLAQIDVTQESVFVGLPMPLTFRPSIALSDEGLIAFSRRNRPYRIERNAKGELDIMSPSGGKGSRWESRVIRELDFWAEENSGVSFSSSGGFRLPDSSMLSPDACWVAQNRWDSLTEAEQTTLPPLCPDFVVEIWSPSDSRSKLQAKMWLWLANGAQLAWMIDPFAQTVSIYRPNLPVEELDCPDSVEAGEPVAGFRLSMHLLWGK